MLSLPLDQVKQAIRRLQQEGHYAFIATGRPYAFLSEAILSFGFDGYILTNGAQVMIGNETIYKEPLDPTFVKNATAEFEQRQIQYMLQSDCYSYMKDECKEYYQFFDSIGISRNYLVSDYQLEDIQTQKIEMLCPNDEAMDMKDECKEYYQFFDSIGISRNYLVSDYQLEDIQTQKIEMLCPNDEAMEYCLSLVEQNPEYDYVQSISDRIFELYSKKNTKATGILTALKHLGIPVEQSYAFGDGKNDIEMLSTVGCGFELYSKKNTKATGILTALKHLGIPVEQSYAFGDGKNDIEMLSTVGCGIAMGNASDEVKSYAHQVTDSVLEDGVASGIEKYILI